MLDQSETKRAALDGYCPVSLLVDNQWKKGSPDWGCYHRGKLYLFDSKEKRDKFLSNPESLSPALAGFDPVIFAKTGELVAGKSSIGLFYPKDDPNARIYLFSSEQSKSEFKESASKFAQTASLATSSIDKARR